MSMHLTRLRVEQLRKFSQLELAGLTPGLNIVAGPNEAGKSTLVRAIRAAFLERYSSSAAVEDLRPTGHSAASPTVVLDFQLDGVAHQLRKSFLSRARCDLQMGTQALSGKEAEDHLAQRLGFAMASRGQAKAEHWGIPGLLWIEQGTGQELPVEHARDYLRSALGAQAADASDAAPLAGGLAASVGDSLLARLQEERDSLLTKAGKPRGEYAQAMEQGEAGALELHALDARIAAYRNQVDELGRLQAEAEAERLQPPETALRAALEQARVQLAQLQQQAQQARADEERAQQLQRTLDVLGQQLLHFQQQAQALAQRAQARTEAEQALAVAQQKQQTAAQQLEAARARNDAARAHWDRAQQAQAWREAHSRWQEALAAQQHWQDAAAQAELLLAQMQQLRQQLSGLGLEQADIEALRRSEKEWQKAEMRRDAAATRLEFALEPGQTLAWRDAAGREGRLDGGGAQWLDQATTLDWPGVGRLTITPGGAGVADVARACAQAQSALAQALARLGVADLAEAEAQWARRSALQGQLAPLQNALTALAPQGVEALQSQRDQARARAAQAQQALAQHPEPAGEAPDWAGAQAAAETAQKDLSRAQQALVLAEQAQALAQSHSAQAAREHGAAQAASQDPAQRVRESEAQEQLVGCRAEQAALAQRVQRSREALAQTPLAFVEQDMRRYEDSLRQLAQRQQLRSNRLLVLGTELQAASAQGLEEQRAQLAGEQARLALRRSEFERRAQALELLVTRLAAKRQAALQRLQAPLQQRLQHYLGLLMPGARLEVGEDLAPASLARPGLARTSLEAVPQVGAIATLSFGAREQLGVISRLAYADLLQAAGQPTLLMLDDTLVHSDALRLAQMKRVLYDAAQRHQLLLFTCHPEDWMDLGVEVRNLPG